MAARITVGCVMASVEPDAESRPSIQAWTRLTTPARICRHAARSRVSEPCRESIGLRCLHVRERPSRPAAKIAIAQHRVSLRAKAEDFGRLYRADIRAGPGFIERGQATGEGFERLPPLRIERIIRRKGCRTDRRSSRPRTANEDAWSCSRASIFRASFKRGLDGMQAFLRQSHARRGHQSRPRVAQVIACAPSEAMRKSHNRDAGKPSGTSLTSGSASATPTTTTI